MASIRRIPWGGGTRGDGGYRLLWRDTSKAKFVNFDALAADKTQKGIRGRGNLLSWGMWSSVTFLMSIGVLQDWTKNHAASASSQVHIKFDDSIYSRGHSITCERAGRNRTKFGEMKIRKLESAHFLKITNYQFSFLVLT